MEELKECCATCSKGILAWGTDYGYRVVCQVTERSQSINFVCDLYERVVEEEREE